MFTPGRCSRKKGTMPTSFFKEAVFAGKHNAAVLMVLNRKADGGSPAR